MKSRMFAKLEYPLSMFFTQVEWAWRNWHFRPVDEEEKWHERVIHFSSEIRNHLSESKIEKTVYDNGL